MTTTSSQAPALHTDDKSDWYHTSYAALTTVLKIAGNVPLPYFKEAVNLTSAIVDIAEFVRQTVQENKEDFQDIADKCISLTNIIYNSYTKSQINKDLWPSKELKEALENLMKVLRKTQADAWAELNRNRLSRFILSLSGAARVKKLRGRLAKALEEFYVSSFLNMDRKLAEILKNSNDILDAVRTPAVADEISISETASENVPTSSPDVETSLSTAGPNQETASSRRSSHRPQGTTSNSGSNNGFTGSAHITGGGNIFSGGSGNITNSGNVFGSRNIMNSGNVSTFGVPGFGLRFNPVIVSPVSS
ncbi:hypothetical protein CVT26_002624 [Gymnopilus dilepis]|uniref:Uncharacterized protein n=1 Tax=Gymnopilus dilepis TaxID=231916 RepID=A0A409VCK3_9AGAR|nr:hypothetical protein CVT26_002624 [Gymnopilus dilepis]